MTCIYFIIAILFVVLFSNKPNKKATYFFWFSFISFIFLCTMFFPPLKTFSNVDKHIISDEGVKFNQFLPLYGFQDMSSISTSEDNDDILFDSLDNSIYGLENGFCGIDVNNLALKISINHYI